MTMQCAPSGADAWRLTPRLLTLLQGNRGTGPTGRIQIFHRLLALNHGHAIRAFRRCYEAAHVPPSAWLPDLGAWLPGTSVRGCLVFSSKSKLYAAEHPEQGKYLWTRPIF